ncbi:MAG: C40 family peptidase [Hungatella hathewayi]|nr:C40 family peptidase [Hungatella hathewayi]
MKINLHRSLTPEGRQLVSAGVMLALGLAVIGGTKDYIPRSFETAGIVATPADALDGNEEPETDAAKENETPESGGMSVKTASPAQAELKDEKSSVRLNMAYEYPDGMETGDAWDSYAGQACELLSELDSNWISEMYGQMKVTPEEMASQLGVGRNGILGLYNPAVETQNPEDADSWVIPSWSKSQVVFQDGDGNQIGGYSNAKDIVAFASVYAYRQGGMDGESFVEYCKKLWEASHQYTVRMGEVYYCDGACQLESGGAEDGEEMESSEALAETSGTSAETSEGDVTAFTESTAALSETSSDSASASDDSVLEAAETLDYNEIRKQYTMDDVPADWESYEGPAREVWESVIAAYDGKAPEQESSAWGNEEVLCPGHLDLEITAVILGLDGARSLFDVDVAGSAAASWQGWTKMNRHHARCIRNQDWEKVYGLPVVSTLYMGNPLSAAEITAYLDMLPEDTTVFQREVIRQALQSVGCIPYYWGGKASRAGYEGNGFGTVVSPDEEGRRLRGLDCSGWINWVYWTALGSRLEYESTSGLAQIGTAIERDQLKAGDIIVRTNTETSHVYLFLAWAPDGEMYVIHETSGDINNVTVSRLNADGPHYRRLLDGES